LGTVLSKGNQDKGGEGGCLGRRGKGERKTRSFQRVLAKTVVLRGGKGEPMGAPKDEKNIASALFPIGQKKREKE